MDVESAVCKEMLAELPTDSNWDLSTAYGKLMAKRDKLRYDSSALGLHTPTENIIGSFSRTKVSATKEGKGGKQSILPPTLGLSWSFLSLKP